MIEYIIFLLIFMIIIREGSFYIIKRLAKEKRKRQKTWFTEIFGNSKKLKKVKEINQIMSDTDLQQEMSNNSKKIGVPDATDRLIKVLVDLVNK